MTQCDKCSRKAVIHQRYSGMHLCREHFEADANRKIREVLRQTGLFGRKARVVVDLDGGRNSATLAYVLKNLFSRRRDIDLAAAVIDECENNSRATEQALLVAERLEMPAMVLRLHYQENETTLISRRARKRQMLYAVARDCRASIIATGEDLDDEALEIFVRYLQGKTERGNEEFDAFGNEKCNDEVCNDEVCSEEERGEEPSGEIHWIKPLLRVMKREVRLYAIGRNLGYEKARQPCADALQNAARRQLTEFDRLHPGTCYSLLRGWDRSFSTGFEGKAFK